ncbi:pirin family protein [Aliidiomarina sanyensis]|uniref:Pirin family protein n=1 Tax=Aliidiomarina sanyensis TaxID=1249555 RepID=A0A432WR89_9GAMM|nr:pirin family protein [Aliidiomarina sanyensis]RUO36278.1 hypothetical protein CWE11_00205 [Aliidiomarina sanyensis]
MTNYDKDCACAPRETQGRHLHSKTSELTPEMRVARILPQKQQRMIGPFCFLDHFGPTAPDKTLEFDVPPHPHIGLQTLSWLWSGSILHLDSLGYEQWLRPGEVNLMTAGKGISHAELIPAGRQSADALHGVQLWLALPPEEMDCEPAFEHVNQLPSITFGDFHGQLILGELGDRLSSVPTRSPAVAFDLLYESDAPGHADIQLNPDFEYLFYVASGEIIIEGHDGTIGMHEGYVVGPGRENIVLTGQGRLLIVGGTPFPEPVKMFWNFVAMDNESLKQAAQEWNAHHEKFGSVESYRQYGDGPARLTSPTWD